MRLVEGVETDPQGARKCAGIALAREGGPAFPGRNGSGGNPDTPRDLLLSEAALPAEIPDGAHGAEDSSGRGANPDSMKFRVDNFMNSG
jgi:hypothetical protein